MKKSKIFLFFLSFSVLSIAIGNFQISNFKSKVKDTNPGWAQQYAEMKGLVGNQINFFGLRNQWAKTDLFNKKSSNVLSFVTEMGPNRVGGRVRALLIDISDSTHLFAGGISGGLWESTNGGISWSAISDHNVSLAVSCITQNPFNPKEIYYGTGEGTGNSADIDGAGVFKSTDGGKTFTQLSATATLPAFATIWDIEFSKTDSSTLYVGTGKGGLFRSQNSGQTFEQIFNTSREINEILTFSDSAIWCSVNGYGLIKGKEVKTISFQKITSTLPSSSYGRISMNYSRNFPNVAFCAFLNTSGSALLGVYKTSNHGTTWKKVTTPNVTGAFSWGWYCFNTNVSPTDTNLILLNAVSPIASNNGGTSWVQIKNSHADYHSSDFYPSGKSFLIGNDGGVHRYQVNTMTNSSVSLNNGLNITQYYTGNYNRFNSSQFIGGTQDNHTILFNGNQFYDVLGGDGSYCAMSSTAPYYNYASYQNGEIRRFNSNFSNETNIKPLGTYSYHFINAFEINPKDGNQIYFLTKNQILASYDAGDNWKNLSSSLSKSVSALGLSSAQDPTVYFGGGGTALYRKKNAFTTQLNQVDLSNTAPTLAKGSVINSIKVSSSNPNTVYISMSDINSKPRVWKLNGAEGDSCKWINISGNLPVSLPVNCVEVNPQDSNMILAGTDFGLYSTKDEGKTWAKEMGVPNVPVFKIVTHPAVGVVYIFTHGRGVFKSQFTSFVNRVKPVQSNLNPHKVVFNNPVESSLNLQIDFKTKSEAGIMHLYNSSGQLMYGNTVTGNDEYNLSHLAQGIYIMRLTIGSKAYDYKVLKL
jgi:photosystem II stability/assembly factor-like uncharacterized protein